MMPRLGTAPSSSTCALSRLCNLGKQIPSLHLYLHHVPACKEPKLSCPHVNVVLVAA